MSNLPPGKYQPRPAAPIGPPIAPVPAGVTRPFWSVVIPTYNRTRYLKQALESVLEQDPGPAEMQIALIDNCSTKADPAAIVEELGATGRVTIFRQAENIPYQRNWNSALERSTGHWVQLLHDDDFVLPGFYAKLRELIAMCPEAGSVMSHSAIVDEDGKRKGPFHYREQDRAGYLDGWMERITRNARFTGPSFVVKRDALEALGGYRLDFWHSSDWELVRRLAVFYPVAYEPAELACYRVHPSSGTSQIDSLGLDILGDHLKSIALVETYLPPEKAAALSNAAREFAALDALAELNTKLVTFRFRQAGTLMRGAWQASHNGRILARLGLILGLFPLRLLNRLRKQAGLAH
jgi:hypothetical protein